MQYADNQSKFVAVLNRKIELPKLLNALGHITAGLVSLIPTDAQEFLTYKDADGGLHPAIAKSPFIVLQADNSNQIRTVRKQAIEMGVAYNDFTESMLGNSAEEQLQQTVQTKDDDMNYFGIILFGDSETLKTVTKKFSLFR